MHEEFRFLIMQFTTYGFDSGFVASRELSSVLSRAFINVAVNEYSISFTLFLLYLELRIIIRVENEPLQNGF
jgi:hypothetical protein